MSPFLYTILIPLIPLVVFLFNGLLGMKFKPMVAGLVGTIGLGIITVLSYVTAWKYFVINGRVGEVYPSLKAFEITWLQFSDTLSINLGILLDPISVMMLVVITTVSFMVHIYSLGYMKGEVGFERFYAFLSSF